MNVTSISHSLDEIRNRITLLESRYHRVAGSVALMAVSKTKPASAVQAAYEAGQRHFGENHLQDALTKLDALPNLDIVWHFIGPIQSNKTRPIAERFAWVHSVDRDKIARRLNDQRPADAPPLNVCIQVNVSGEATKSGVAPEQVCELATVIQALPRLRLRGLMAIPKPAADLAEQRQPFARLRAMLSTLEASGLDVDTLSMGMTDDMEAAIAEGSTMVRIGTAIFGAREGASFGKGSGAR